MSRRTAPRTFLLAALLAAVAARAEAPGPAARSLVLFVGDGMGLSTVTAARILAGQLRGEPGEDNRLAFERLPHTALVRVHSADAQVPDSAATMTAILTGVRTRSGLVAVGPQARRGDCASARGARLRTLFDEAEAAGLATGIVTTARVTHATPAAAYAHVPERRWESDADLPDAARRAGCLDIARQLVERPPGDGLEVVLGGGRAAFLPWHKGGRRLDGRDLVAAWRARHPDGARVHDRAGLAAVDPRRTRRLLGLFAPSHMAFEVDRPEDPGGEPSLAEMAAKAVAVLARDPDGYLLVVEGARIDHGHHLGDAFRALTETIAFAQAVHAVLARVDLRETLVVVTADHGAPLVIAGYPVRGNPILGPVVEADPEGGPPRLARDARGRPYPVLSYANGPGALPGTDSREPARRPAPALVPLPRATHSGEDVPLYAAGPGAARFRGALDQPGLHGLLRAALGIDRRLGKEAARGGQ